MSTRTSTGSAEDRYGVEDTGEFTEQQLDNNGNVFVLLIGDSSCFPGTSLIEADLEDKPFTTLEGHVHDRKPETAQRLIAR